jgi:hypothetical protein
LGFFWVENIPSGNPGLEHNVYEETSLHDICHLKSSFFPTPKQTFFTEQQKFIQTLKFFETLTHVLAD